MKKREGLGLGSETPQGTIELEELTGTRPLPRLNRQQIEHIGEMTGFVSRDPVRQKKPRQPTPYIIQRNFKFRAGMGELLESVALRLGLNSQQAIEQGLLALIEKKGLGDLKAEFERLLK